MPSPVELDREQRLDEIIAAYLKALKEGEAPARQELLESNPDLADDLAAFFADQDRFDRVAAPLRTVVPLPDRLGKIRKFGDYEILEEIARGGMGVVFKAWQKSLGRVVAVKMLLAGQWASASDLKRFHAEAEAVASLDHPNIVPIHEVGTFDNNPYLVMKLVDGGSLGQVIGRPPWRVDNTASARRVASLLATIADAIHYAHQCGILHRDLKPANILLQQREHGSEALSGSGTRLSGSSPVLLADPDGSSSALTPIPIITDFGLAKRSQRPASPDGSSCRAVTTAPPTMPQPLALTHTGAIVGTPAYMAPEQASGAGIVTTAADVYGLGAILYEMLTMRPPFKGATPVETMRLVLEQEPVRPSIHNPRVNRDLETICLKCLHKEPERRYGSAHDLADDLRRFLRDEPILARPITRLERVYRFARREPVTFWLTSALCAVILVSLVGLSALWRNAVAYAHQAEGERDKALRAEGVAEKHRQEAVEDFQLAHQAVHDYVQRVSAELQDAPYLWPFRKALLESALAYYGNFLRRHGQDPEQGPTLRRELAETYRNVGSLTSMIGSRADARTAYEQALTIYRDLKQAAPDNVEVLRGVGETLNQCGILTETTEGAFQRFEEARDVYTQALSAHPDDSKLRSGLASVLNNLGLVSQRMGRLHQAADWYRQARTLQEKLLAVDPNNTSLQKGLAGTLACYAALRNQEPGGEGDTQKALEEVCKIRYRLAKANPRDTQRQADLATAQSQLGTFLRDHGQEAKGREELGKSHGERLRLERDNPSVLRFKVDLAASHTELGHDDSLQGRTTLALGNYRRARDLLLQVMPLDPSPGIRRELALAYWRIGTIMGDLKQPGAADAVTSFQEARLLLEALVKADPANLDYRLDLGRTLNHFAGNRLTVGRPQEALQLLTEAMPHLERALGRASQVAIYRKTLSNTYSLFAEAEVRLDHTREATQQVLERKKLWDGNPNELYRVAKDLASLAGTVGGGKPRLTPEEETEQRQDLDLALDVLKEAASSGFQDLDRLQKEKVFNRLRDRNEFQDVVREVERRQQDPKTQRPGRPLVQ
jgi:serine/threonine protein kinase